MQGIDALHGLLGPPRCEGCGARAGPLCEACRDRLSRPVETAAVPGVDRALARWAYEGAARNLILALKLRSVRAAAAPLVAAMRAEVLSSGLLGDVVTWVPGRRKDASRRGYDHAELLGRGFARALGLEPVALLLRTGERVDQTTLGAEARRRNLVGAFEGPRQPGGGGSRRRPDHNGSDGDRMRPSPPIGRSDDRRGGRSMQGLAGAPNRPIKVVTSH